MIFDKPWFGLGLFLRIEVALLLCNGKLDVHFHCVKMYYICPLLQAGDVTDGKEMHSFTFSPSHTDKQPHMKSFPGFFVSICVTP